MGQKYPFDKENLVKLADSGPFDKENLVKPRNGPESAQILLSRLPALSRSLENAALASAELLAEFWPLVAFAFMPYRHTQTRSFGTPVWSSNFSSVS